MMLCMLQLEIPANKMPFYFKSIESSACTESVGVDDVIGTLRRNFCFKSVEICGAFLGGVGSRKLSRIRARETLLCCQLQDFLGDKMRCNKGR
jgi:hypothetical protein